MITTDANELVAEIHNRMPLILAPGDYARWLSEEPNPYELMRPFPAGLMRMWPISTRVNKPENDDPSIIEPIELATAAVEARNASSSSEKSLLLSTLTAAIGMALASVVRPCHDDSPVAGISVEFLLCTFQAVLENATGSTLRP